MSRATRYFHGGPRGLKGFILPPAETGAKCASDYGTGHVHKRDRVYVTTDFAAALIFASMTPNDVGIVYEVQPIGTMTADRDCDQPGLSFECPSARIIRPIPVKKRKLARVRRLILVDEGLL